MAFVAGTFVFTDTIDASFKDLFERVQRGVDVSVQQKQAVEEDFGVPPTMPSDTLERVQSVPGVEEAAGYVSADGSLLDPEGEPILSNGPPTIIVTSGPDRSTRSTTPRAARRATTRWCWTRPRPTSTAGARATR